jgi:oligopeptidase B
VPELSPPTAKQVHQRHHRPTGDVDDAWAWLADRTDPDVEAYLNAENDYTTAWFAPHDELVEELFAEIRSRVREDDLSAPVRKGPWWYVTRTITDAAYPVHCRGVSADTATEFILLDENVEAEGHDHFELGAFDLSPDHHLLAWASDLDGSERYTLRIRHVAPTDGAAPYDLDDRIEGTSWGGTAWSTDATCLFYVMPDAAMRPYQVWRHVVGTPATHDVLVWEEPDERFFVHLERTRSDAWIVITSASHTSSEVWVLPAHTPHAAPLLVRARVDDVEYSVDDAGDGFVIVTNLDAVDFRVMTSPYDQPHDWSEVIAHEPGRRIVAAEPFAGHVVVHWWRQAQQELMVRFPDGSQRTIVGLGEPHNLELDANPEWHTDLVRFHLQSLTTPPTVIDEQVHSGERTVVKVLPTPHVDLSRYTARRLWATAPDGVAVPVDVVHRTDLPTNGTAPCVVYGYGAYEASMPPWFSVARLSLVDRGWVWALAHPRGGGELGRQWYLDGKLLAKRTTFTDTLAVADHLVEQRLAAPDALALRGGSAGGLLVGACITLRPHRWRAAVAEVPFVDVVTTMSDPSLPLTVTEWEEWGDPRAEPFASYIASYSPYDLITPEVATALPALYVTAGLNDPRVSYHEPAKWVAKMRALGAGTATGRVVLLRCEMGAGHGGPTGRYDRWRDEARILAFLLTTAR